MASKLYPPILEASIPAFYGNTVKIPFLHNPLVGKKEYIGFVLLVKNINGTVILTCRSSAENNGIVYFNISSLGSNNGWFKFLLAYENKLQVGYYSGVAIGRYLGAASPFVTLKNNGQGVYEAIYSHTGDSDEKAYSYRFTITDWLGNLIEDTGEQIHNTSGDTSTTSSSDFYTFKYNLNDENATYLINYTLLTVNGLELTDYLVITNQTLQTEEDPLFTIYGLLDAANGRIRIYAMSNQEEDITGSFIVRRTCNKDRHFRVQDICTFSLIEQPVYHEYTINDKHYKEKIKILLAEDYTIEAGYYYIYYIQRFNTNHAYSSVISQFDHGAIYATFEDCFLYDGERQLRILYNPKISSFKTNILAQKTETIGSKYPFISRNGNVEYKEFPISGLISFQMDENNLFMTKDDKERLGIIADRGMRSGTNAFGPAEEDAIRNKPQNRRMRKKIERDSATNLHDININGEKEFKLLVLDFLNNGKPKLFRSATEGNYCVYIMNSSLTPNDTLGRMLHTFNSTAYEIQKVEDFYNELVGNDVLLYDSQGKLDKTMNIKEYHNKTVTLFSQDKEVIFNLLNPAEYARSVLIRNADPLSKYTFYIKDIYHLSEPARMEVITIGATGSYNYFCTDKNEYITDMYIGDRTSANRKDISYCSTILFKNYIKLPTISFDYFGESANKTIVNEVFGLKKQTLVVKSWYNIFRKYVLKTAVPAFKKPKINFTQRYELDASGAGVSAPKDIGALLQRYIYYTDKIFYSSLYSFIKRYELMKNEPIIEETSIDFVSFLDTIENILAQEPSFSQLLSYVTNMRKYFKLRGCMTSNQGITFIDDYYSHKKGVKVESRINKLYNITILNFNEHYGEFVYFSVGADYQIWQEACAVLHRLNSQSEIEVSERLYNYLSQLYIPLGYYNAKEMPVVYSVKNKYLLEIEGSVGTPRYILTKGKIFNGTIYKTIRSELKALAKQKRNELFVPPSGTYNVPLNFDDISNIVIWGKTGSDIRFNISAEITTSNYSFGGLF